MNLLDLLLLGILAASIAAGFKSGFTRAAFGVVATVLGIVLGFWFYGVPAVYVQRMISMPDTVANIIGFVLVYGAVTLVGAFGGGLVATLFKWTGLGWMDRLLGIGFGFVRGALIVIASVAILMAFTPRPAPNWMTDSRILPYAIDASNQVAQLAPRGLKDEFAVGLASVRGIWDEQLKRARERGEQALEGIRPE